MVRFKNFVNLPGITGDSQAASPQFGIRNSKFGMFRGGAARNKNNSEFEIRNSEVGIEGFAGGAGEDKGNSETLPEITEDYRIRRLSGELF